jgi:hypothetical protein
MTLEDSKRNSEEMPEQRFDQYHRESLEIAQEISRKWAMLRKRKKEDPNFLAGDPVLEEIDLASRPPKSGIQVWFESKLKFINTAAGNNPDARSRMMHRVKEDLERIKLEVENLVGDEAGSNSGIEVQRQDNREKHKKLSQLRGEIEILGNPGSASRTEKREQKTILRRSDIDGKRFDESIYKLLEENGFKLGDKVMFFAERERDGILERDHSGSVIVRDDKGNPWGIIGIMTGRDSYIRKP